MAKNDEERAFDGEGLKADTEARKLEQMVDAMRRVSHES